MAKQDTCGFPVLKKLTIESTGKGGKERETVKTGIVTEPFASICDEDDMQSN